MKLTRHNGRFGKHGTYNPRHNDRRFDVENSEHIDAERARQNVYWDCYRGFTTHEFRENPEQPDFSFEEIERMYYYEHYSDHVEAQNARNEKTRHTERNRTVEDLLKNNKTCPEESIYQIGTLGESVSPDTLFSIVNEFYEEFERRFGFHIHILDWALHLDEGTPHIHERHGCAKKLWQSLLGIRAKPRYQFKPKNTAFFQIAGLDVQIRLPGLKFMEHHGPDGTGTGRFLAIGFLVSQEGVPDRHQFQNILLAQNTNSAHTCSSFSFNAIYSSIAASPAFRVSVSQA